MILTVQATEIAPCTGYRQTLRAWMEMIQRLFLDGIDCQRTGFAINLADQHAVPVSATATKACLAIGDMAMVRTDQTFQSPVVEGLKIRWLHTRKVPHPAIRPNPVRLCPANNAQRTLL